jgi:2-hydroxy-6-oxonona-2,4-dienedioate hydrolase
MGTPAAAPLTRLTWAVAGSALVAFARARYQRDLRRDQERLDTFKPSVIDTPFGRVEYAQAGDGPPVLVVHGVFGGFDFGVGVGRVNVPPGYRIISPSRLAHGLMMPAMLHPMLLRIDLYSGHAMGGHS